MIVNRLPAIMDKKAVSIRELSRLTGITYTTVRAVYHGERRSVQLDVLDAICLALDVQPGQIYKCVPEGGNYVEDEGRSHSASRTVQREVNQTRGGRPANDWSVWE